MLESNLQYLQLLLRHFTNVMDHLQQKKDQNMALVRGLIQSMHQSAKEIHEFPHNSFMLESSLQYLQLRLRQCTNVADRLEQQQDQKLALLRGLIPSITESVKEIHESQQKEAESIRSLQQPANVTEQFQQQQDQNLAIIREMLQSMHQSVKEIHESQQREAKSIRSLEQPATVTDRFLQQQHHQNMTVMRELLQTIKDSVEEMHEAQQNVAKSIRSLEQAVERLWNHSLSTTENKFQAARLANYARFEEGKPSKLASCESRM